MTEENKDINNLNDLSKLNQTEESASIEREPKIDKLGRSYSTGRRKESTARVWVKRGTGKITINGKDMPLYFARPVLQMQLNFVFDVTERKDQFDVISKRRYVNGPSGALCTFELKKSVRQRLEKEIDYDGQIFGFEYSKKEINRAIRFKEQYPDAKPIFPLIEHKLNKKEAS